MANIQKRTGKGKETTYRVQIRLRGFPTESATFERLTDAKAWAAQTETAIRDHKHFPQREAQRHTLNDLARRYLEAVERKKPDAHAKQKQIMGWWQKQLGDYALAIITPAMIAEKRDLLLSENIGTDEEPRHRSPPTANRYLAALSKAMSDAAREWNWLRENPVRRVTKETESQGRVRYLSDDERTRLLKACRESNLPELELIVQLAITTGMRKGEILGLRWPDIDLARAQAVLHKTKNRERRGASIVPHVLALLKDHAKVRRLDTDLVFPQPSKNKPVIVDARFREAVAKAKIKDFHFHDLRHTAASYLAMSGATVPEIAAILGHKTLAMVKRYSHLSEAHTSAVVERMSKKFFGDAAA